MADNLLDVKKGWIVRVAMHFENGIGYIQDVKREADDSLVSVCITGEQPDSERFNTHWIGMKRWQQVFVEHFGDTEPCQKCGKVPTESWFYPAAANFVCVRCGHEWWEKEA